MPIGLYLFKRKQSSIAPDIPIDAKPSAASSNSTLENLEHFSGLELGLLKMFLQKHSIQEVIVIDDLNKFLGLHSKNESIQKKIRSESLNHLNEKLQLLCHLNEDAIVKTRSSFDKRSFEYQINPLFIEPIKRMGITYKE
jgi:hypothetical protein